MNVRPWFLALWLLFLAGAAHGAERRVPHGVRLVEDGQTVLVLEGTHRERGEALGRLAGAEIVALVGEYGLALLPAPRLAALRAMAPLLLRVPDWAWEEARGVIAGMDAAQVPRLIPSLDRSLDALDLVLLTTIPDSGGLACSSLSAWGPDTDPSLAGAALLARNLDFFLPESSVAAVRAAQAVVVHVPSEADEHPWLSVGMLGFLGALSGFDDAGRGAFLNLDVGAEPVPLARVFGRGATPTAVALREGLERRDSDGDGDAALPDLVAALRAHPRVGAVLVHAIATKPAPEAVVIEADPNGVTVRTAEPGARHLILTNHARSRRAPASCDRYARLADAAEREHGRLDTATLQRALASVAFDGRTLRTLETMVYEPSSGRIGVGFLGQRHHAGGTPLGWHSLAPLVHELR